ncbi:MAG: hypothetical protein Q4D16_20155 [Eubacteriales bacterium]|nr:hypothetical protein [Eubacteriales bacterium]
MARWLGHARRLVNMGLLIRRPSVGDYCKQLILVFLSVGMLGMLCFVSGCKKDVLPQPTFPLDEEVVNAALEKSGLPGILSESETASWAEGQMVHAVRSLTITYSDTISAEEANANPITRLLIASIVSNSSEITEGKRMLFIRFGQIDVPDQMTWEDWKQQIVFATLLYGGFEDEEQVYQAFADKELPCLHGESSFQAWDAQLPGGYCIVNYRISNETSKPVAKQEASMGVYIYESKELYQRIQQKIKKPATQAEP